MVVSLFSKEPASLKAYENPSVVPSPIFANRALPFSGPAQKPELAWKFHSNTHAIESSLTIDREGMIYFGSNDDKVYALEPFTGSIQWTFQTKGDVKSSVIISQQGILLFASRDGTLYALDKHGTLQWTYKAKAPIFSTPALDSSGNVIFGDVDGYIYVIAPRGVLLQRFKLALTIRNAIVVDQNDTLYVGLEDGRFVSFTKEGKINWYFKTNSSIASDAVIGDDGAVYIASKDWHLYRLDQRGKEVWRYRTLWFLTSAVVMGDDNTLYIGSWDWSIHALSSASGERIWTNQPERSPHASYFASQIIVDAEQRIYAASRNNNVYCFDRNGKLLWKIRIEGGDVSSGLMLHPNGMLLIPTDKGNVYAYKILAESIGVK